MDLASEIYFVPNMSTQSKNQTIHKCTRLNQVKWQKPF